MPRFQLVFRDRIGERSEIRDSNMHPMPHIAGAPILDGETYMIRGTRWVIRRDGRLDGMERFLCTPAE